MPARTKRREIEYGIVQLNPFGMLEVLGNLLDLGPFEDYAQGGAKDNPRDGPPLGHSFLVILALERLIDSVLLDPAMFGLRWNDLVDRARQRSVPFSEFPDKSGVGKVVRFLTNHYREFLSVRSFAQLRRKANRTNKEILYQMVRWGEGAEFFEGPKSAKFDKSRVRQDLAELFLVNCVQDLAYVVAAHNNTFQRGRWFHPQFRRLETEMGTQKFFEGFKLGAAYLWHCVLGDKAEELFTRRILSAKDWLEYYQVHPVIRRLLTDEAWDRVQKIKSIQLPAGAAFRGLKRESHSEKDYLHRLDDIFKYYDVRLVGETYTARLGTEFLSHLIGAMTFDSRKVSVLRFVHPEGPFQNRFSYAIFNWVPIRLGDQSEWLLFFCFCDDYSPRGLSAYEPIETFFKKHRTRIQVSSFRFTPLELLNYVMERPDWSKSVMDPLTREHNELGTLSGLRAMMAEERQEKGFGRGIVLELLMMLVASKMGYEVRWRVETLGRELDILAYRSFDSGAQELLIAECSTQLLENDLKELEEKVRLATSNKGKLLERFDKRPTGEVNVSGWLVTTDRRYPAGWTKSGQISVISWDLIKEILQTQGIVLPAGLENHLTREQLSPRDILDPQSVISGVSPPPSEDGSPPKRRIMLADGLLLPKNWPEILDGKGKYSE